MKLYELKRMFESENHGEMICFTLLDLISL